MWLELAHVLPVEHGAAGDAVLTIALLTAGVFASVLVGAWMGGALLARWPRAALAALSAGMLLFLAYDLLKESASLGQNLVARPLLPLALLASFAVGILLIPTLARDGTSKWLAWSWIMGIGFHSLGEGYVLGTEATTASLGNVPGVASFLLHKGIEAFTIPILAGLVLGWRGGILAALALASATFFGAFLGVFLGSSLFPLLAFAAGAGAVAYVMLRLAREAPMDARHAALVLLGLLAVYGAGMLHEL